MKKQLIKLLSISAIIFSLTGTLISCGESSSSSSTTSEDKVTTSNITTEETTTSEEQTSTREETTTNSEGQTSTEESSSETPLSPTKTTYRYEFEDSEMIDNAPSQDPLVVESHEKASNGKCVGFFRSGDVLKFTFEAEKAENNVPLTVCGSSTKGVYDKENGWALIGMSAVSASKLNNVCYINNTPVVNWLGQFNPSGNQDNTGQFPEADYFNFSKVSTTVNLKQGTNIIEFRYSDTTFNWDYIELTTTDNPLSNSGSSSIVGGDEVDVYFIAGQSNAAGCSDFYRSDLTTLNLSSKYASKANKYINGFDNVYYYGKAYDVSQNSLTNFTKLTPVKTCMGITYSHDFGAELGMGEYLNSFYADSNKKAVIIKYAVCASGLISNASSWAEWSTPSYPNPRLNGEPNLYDNMLGTNANNYTDGLLYSALNEIKASGFSKVNYKGFYWSQGESDAGKDDYDDALTALINDVRRDVNRVSDSFKSNNKNIEIGSSSNLPFLISEIAPTQAGATKLADGSSSDANINEIVGQQRAVASSMNNVSTLSTVDYDIVNNVSKWQSSVNDGVSYSADPWHYNGDDMIEIGNKVGEILYTYGETKTATVTFDTNGCSTQIVPQTVKLNQKIKMPESPKYTYTDSYGKTYNFVLENWYNGEKVWDFDNDAVTTNVTLKANWTLDDSYFAINPNAHIRAKNTTARVMSFNVLADDWNNKPAVDDTRANQAFNTIERYAPDVVGLQEFDDQWYSKASTLLNGYKVINVDNNKPFGATNYSTLAYNTSKVKVVEYTQKALTTYDSPNVCRNVTIGVFEFIAGENVGKQFIVTSTHFDVNNVPGQTTQAGELANIAKELETKYPSLPIILTGDFNTREETTPYNTFMSKSGYIDTKLDALEKGIIGNSVHLGTPMRTSDRNYKDPNHIFRGPSSFSSANILLETCIDHIFATNNVTSLYHSLIIDEDALNASDHCPIYSDLQF